MSKQIGLGTALWGWSVDQATAFAILDYFYGAGYRWVDTAMNYPINGNPADFRRSVTTLTAWCRDREVSDLQIVCKIGSLSNQKSPEHNLHPDFLAQELQYLRLGLGSNLAALMIHWDNRDDVIAIANSLTWLQAQGVGVGLSGIKHPEIYATCGQHLSTPQIQIKHNFLSSGLDHYAPLAPWQPQFWAYGIAVSGLKLSQQQYEANSYVRLTKGDDYHTQWLTPKRQMVLETLISSHPALQSLYHVGLAYAEQDTRLAGYLLAPTTLAKATDALSCLAALRHDPPDLNCLTQL